MFLSEPVVSFRVLGKRGNYPNFSLLTPTHAFFSSPHLIWSAVVQRPLPDEWVKAEVCTLTPEETRLLGAIFMSEKDPFEQGTIHPQLWVHRHIALEGDPPDLSSEDFRTFAEQEAQDMAREDTEAKWYPPQREGDYDRQDTGSMEDARRFLNACDVEDQLLLAGIGRFLSSLRLCAESFFREEAFVQATISLGAAMEYIRLHLEQKEGAVQSFANVCDYFRTTFPFGDHFPDWLKWVYDLRVAAIHPSSRLGEMWIPPLDADDPYELEKWLVVIYRHIILSEIPDRIG